MASQVNAEMRKMQGNLGLESSGEDCQRAFKCLFKSELVDYILQSVPEGEERRQMSEHLCQQFQVIIHRIYADNHNNLFVYTNTTSFLAESF